MQLLGVGSAAAAGCNDTGSQEGEENENEFEYVVVGSGAGGAPLACNLARHGHRVLLIEAGSDQGALLTQQVPALHVRSTEEETMRWDFFVKHYDDATQAASDSKFVADPGPGHEPGILYPRAGTLGGCTAHHAMITVYPHASDFEYIADLTGDESWRADNMRRYFEILENCLYVDRDDPDETRGHGLAGWLSTAMTDARIGITDSKLLKMVVAAAKAFSSNSFSSGALAAIFSGNAFALKQLVGLMNRDLNAPTPGRDGTEGMFGIPLATDGRQRRGPRELILDTVAAGHPLVVRPNALVTRVLWSDAPASDGSLVARGVEYLQGQHLYRADPLADAGSGGERREVTATREVILSAGVFNTPQLLKLSGVGPAAELDVLGIEVKIDLPGVGTNLQDRYEVGVVGDVPRDFSAIQDCTFGQEPDPCLDEWREGGGPYTSNGAVTSLVLKSRPELPECDLIVFGIPRNFRGYEPGYGDIVLGDNHHFTWAILKAHTGNHAGTVELRSTDPRDVPDIRFRYFHEGTTAAGEDQRDLDAMVRGVEFARTIGAHVNDLLLFSSYDEVWPGPSVATRADVERWIKSEAWGHHASCTCAIGADADPMAVLDARFRVRGTHGLRVVDASVFPKIPGFFIVVPIYMISEKATDVLLEDIGEERNV